MVSVISPFAIMIIAGRIATDQVQLMNATNALVFSINNYKYINGWNRSISETMGYSKEVVIGHYLVN